MIMPLRLYNFDCPYCGSTDSIDIQTSKIRSWKRYYEVNTKTLCCKCKKEFAVHYNEDGNFLSDYNRALHKYMEEYMKEEKRDIDEFPTK